MISDWELWACAKHVLAQHGDGAAAFTASRIEALDLAGDIEGVRTWRAIGSRLQQLTEDASDRWAQH